MKALKLYYKPSCAFSSGMLSFLFLRGADFQALNLELDEAREADLNKRLGERKLETPTLEVDGKLWVAPTMSDVKDLLQQWGLPKSEAPHTRLKKHEAD